MEKNEYHLIIDINGDMGNGGAISDNTSKIDKQQRALANLVKYQIARPFIEATKQSILNSVDSTVGSKEVSQRIQAGLDTVQDITNTAITGVSLASALGVSDPAAAAIAIAVSVVKKVLDIAVNQVDIYNKTLVENEQLNILKGRAGIQFNRSRMGE